MTPWRGKQHLPLINLSNTRLATRAMIAGERVHRSTSSAFLGFIIIIAFLLLLFLVLLLFRPLLRLPSLLVISLPPMFLISPPPPSSFIPFSSSHQYHHYQPYPPFPLFIFLYHPLPHTIIIILATTITIIIINFRRLTYFSFLLLLPISFLCSLSPANNQQATPNQETSRHRPCPEPRAEANHCRRFKRFQTNP